MCFTYLPGTNLPQSIQKHHQNSNCFFHAVQVHFLSTGQHRSLAERCSGVVVESENPNAPRTISFEYLNQQLVWGELQQFVMFLMPLLSPRALAASPFAPFLASAWSRIKLYATPSGALSLPYLQGWGLTQVAYLHRLVLRQEVVLAGWRFRVLSSIHCALARFVNWGSVDHGLARYPDSSSCSHAHVCLVAAVIVQHTF